MLVDIPARLEGAISRNGVKIAFQVFGDGPRSLLLLPTWTIVHSDFWHRQVPHLAPRYTVVTFDGRGNGSSDRPAGAHSYGVRETVDDALAVMDAVGTDRVGVLAVSAGAEWAALLAAEHAERVAAVVFIGSSMALGPDTEERTAAATAFDKPQADYKGWGKWNRHYWRQDWPGFLEFFFSRCFTEPDSRTYIDHFIQMGLQTTPDIVAITVGAEALEGAAALNVAGAISCPCLVIHGDEDAIAPLQWGIDLARITRAELHVLPGAGHEPQLREAEETNRLIDGFLARVWPPLAGA